MWEFSAFSRLPNVFWKNPNMTERVEMVHYKPPKGSPFMKAGCIPCSISIKSRDGRGVGKGDGSTIVVLVIHSLVCPWIHSLPSLFGIQRKDSTSYQDSPLLPAQFASWEAQA